MKHYGIVGVKNVTVHIPVTQEEKNIADTKSIKKGGVNFSSMRRRYVKQGASEARYFPISYVEG